MAGARPFPRLCLSYPLVHPQGNALKLSQFADCLSYFHLIFYLWFRRLINYIDRSSLAGVNDVTWSRPQYITLSQLRYKRARVSVDFCPLGVVISRFRKSLDDRLRMRRICDDPIVGTWRTIVYQRRPIAVDSKNHDCCLCRIARFRKRT